MPWIIILKIYYRSIHSNFKNNRVKLINIVNIKFATYVERCTFVRRRVETTHAGVDGVLLTSMCVLHCFYTYYKYISYK